jgi:hypothetical protein
MDQLFSLGHVPGPTKVLKPARRGVAAFRSLPELQAEESRFSPFDKLQHVLGIV